jgi:acetoin utilization deacetylase AcuC-like enzyme
LSKTALVYGSVFLKHETGGHPENKNRVKSTYDYLRSRPVWGKLTEIAPRQGTREEICLVHSEEYYAKIVSLPRREMMHLDPDTIFGPGSLEAALAAVGAVTLAVERVRRGELESAFCLVRPPGHHARPSRAMGFCIFNNVAIGAAVARHVCGLPRVAIIDFDVHHGNGTQEMFYTDETVLYTSIHQWPFYPGTGAPGERGHDRGAGKTVNVPLLRGAGEDAYMQALGEIILPAVKEHRPSIILVSAGFDAHEADLIGGMRLESESYRRMTEAIREVALEVCEGRIVSALEGGYNLEALAASVEAHLEALTE